MTYGNRSYGFLTNDVGEIDNKNQLKTINSKKLGEGKVLLKYLKNMNVLTKKELKDIFKKVGIKTGMKVMVHSSLSKLGYLVNGAEDIIDALLEIISLKKGTLFIPTHSGQLTNPIHWKIGGFNAKEKKK